jgi:hypothetical protein
MGEEKKEHDLGQTLVYQGPLMRDGWEPVFRKMASRSGSRPDAGKIY